MTRQDALKLAAVFLICFALTWTITQAASILFGDGAAGALLAVIVAVAVYMLWDEGENS